MSDGTGTDPGTDRCDDCGHLWERPCACSCCGLVVELYEAAATLYLWRRLKEGDRSGVQ